MICNIKKIAYSFFVKRVEKLILFYMIYSNEFHRLETEYKYVPVVIQQKQECRNSISTPHFLLQYNRKVSAVKSISSTFEFIN